MPQDKFDSENPAILTAQLQTADNNQTALQVALNESQGPKATSVTLQASGLDSAPGTTSATRSVGAAATGTIGAALSGAGTVPGESGDDDPECPERSQFVRVKDGGIYVPRRADEITLEDFLWNPISKEFERVVRADLIEGVDLIHIFTANEVEAVGSTSHPLIREHADPCGLKLVECTVGIGALTVMEELEQSVVEVLSNHQKGAVVHLETAGPHHIYAGGTDPDKMIVWHNLKPLEEFDN